MTLRHISLHARRLAILILGVYLATLKAQTTLDQSELEASAKQELAATQTPGAAIGIIQVGKLIYAKGFGTSNIETGAPVTPEMLSPAIDH